MAPGSPSRAAFRSATKASTEDAGDADKSHPESFLLALLTSRAEHKDTRFFAHATSETQIAICDTYAARNTSQAPSSNANVNEPGFLEVFPKVVSRPPRLLQELEALLLNKQRNVDKLAWPGPQLPKDRDPGLAANMQLDVQRQVLAAFAQGFSAYTSLLMRIQAQFERTIAEGLACAYANVGLRAKLAEQATARLRTAREVRMKILGEEVGFRAQAFAKLQDTKERTARLARRAAAAERDLQAAREEQDQLQRLVVSLRATAEALASSRAVELAWVAQPASAAMQRVPVGPLLEQDRAFLDSEFLSAEQRRSLQRTANAGD